MVLINRTRLSEWAKELVPFSEQKRSGTYLGLSWSVRNDDNNVIVIKNYNHEWDRKLVTKFLNLPSRSFELDARTIIKHKYLPHRIDIRNN